LQTRYAHSTKNNTVTVASAWCNLPISLATKWLQVNRLLRSAMPLPENRPCNSVAFVVTAFFIFSALGAYSTAQENKAWQFPAELKPALDDRPNVFLNAQSDGRWDDVSDLLGDYRRGYFSGYLKFTQSHKACLVSEMQKFPMVSFDYTIQDSPFSSEILMTPPGRRWWRLVGEGTFRSGTKTVKQATWLTAYRDRENWFFSPPDFDGADTIRERQKEASKDRKDQVDLLIPPDCPLEVVELHVFDDPKNPAARDIYFRLHNKTGMTVTRYGYEITDERGDGSISFGTGEELAPNGISREYHENDVVYQYWCEGEPRIRIKIDHAAMAGGTEWSAPESPSTKKAKQ